VVDVWFIIAGLFARTVLKFSSADQGVLALAGGEPQEIAVVPDPSFDYIWFWRARLPERKGERCRILVRSRRLNSCLVEFPDGFRVVTSRNAVRRRRSHGPTAESDGSAATAR
jgi:hypothetical protein